MCFWGLLGSIWALLWPEIRPLWPWQGLVLLCHDASIAPSGCLLPGPKTICCKLCYSLFRLICCLRTWCDWVSIHTTTLKLPASWPQTPIVTASVQDGRSGTLWVCVSERKPSLCSPIFTSSSSGIRKTKSPDCGALTCHSYFYSRLICLQSSAAFFVFCNLITKRGNTNILYLLKMPVILGYGVVSRSSFNVGNTEQRWAGSLLLVENTVDTALSICIQY